MKYDEMNRSKELQQLFGSKPVLISRITGWLGVFFLLVFTSFVVSIKYELTEEATFHLISDHKMTNDNTINYTLHLNKDVNFKTGQLLQVRLQLKADKKTIDCSGAVSSIVKSNTGCGPQTTLILETKRSPALSNAIAKAKGTDGVAKILLSRERFINQISKEIRNRF